MVNVGVKRKTLFWSFFCLTTQGGPQEFSVLLFVKVSASLTLPAFSSLVDTFLTETFHRMASHENGQRWHPVEQPANGDGKSGLLVNNSLCNEKVPFIPHSKDQGEVLKQVSNAF